MTEAVSLLSRWCQDNLVHGDTRHSWGGGVFTNSNWIKTLYPSIEVMFLGQMESQYINPFKQLLNTRYINPLLPHPLTAGDLVNSKGVFADPAMGENDGSGTINFPQTIGFVKHCTYAGCQSTGGMLHWILKAINIPSKMYSGFMGDVSGNFPGAMHKGIEVFTGQSETMVVGHADHFYQGMSVYYSAIASQSFTAHYLDPHKDLIDIFAPKSLIEWWLPPYNGTQAGSDPNYNSAQRELYYSFMIMTGAIRQFSTYVVEWWKEYERVSRVEGNMDLDRILWVKYLKGLKGPSTGFVDRALPFVFSRIKDRISDIEQNINTQWGKKLSDYEAGMKAWHLTHYANKTDYTLWIHP